MSERDDLDMMVAEFVLGTLPEEERDALQARRAREPELEALIQQWEARLAGMLDGVEPVEPGPELFARIQRAIEQQPSAPKSPSAVPDNVISLRKQLTRWRWSTAIASAAALVLVAVLATQPEPEPQAQSFVAVFQHNDEQPAFLLTVDLNSRQLNIQPVTAEPEPDKSYQLWIVAEGYGPNPRSVGVMGDNFTWTRLHCVITTQRLCVAPPLASAWSQRVVHPPDNRLARPFTASFTPLLPTKAKVATKL